MNINDCILGALGPGQINDLLLQYYKDNGALSSDINDAEREFLEGNGSDPATINDMWYQLLRDRGAVGSLSDMLKEFWCVDGGALTFRMQRGAISEDGLTITVIFSDKVTFTEGLLPNGMTATNTTKNEAATIISAVGSGTDTVVYTVTWPSAILEYGDDVVLKSDGTGDYQDTEATPLPLQTLRIHNPIAPPEPPPDLSGPVTFRGSSVTFKGVQVYYG